MEFADLARAVQVSVTEWSLRDNVAIPITLRRFQDACALHNTHLSRGMISEILGKDWVFDEVTSNHWTTQRVGDDYHLVFQTRDDAHKIACVYEIALRARKAERNV